MSGVDPSEGAEHETPENGEGEYQDDEYQPDGQDYQQYDDEGEGYDDQGEGVSR